MTKGCFTDKEVEFIKDREAIPASSRWNYEDRVEEKAEEGVPQILELLPDLLPHVDADQIQSQVDPSDVGVAFAQLFTRDQKLVLAGSLVWSEQRPEESDAEFVERVPNLIEEYADDIAKRVRINDQYRRFPLRIYELLWDELERIRDRTCEDKNIEMAVPLRPIIEWVHEQGEIPEGEHAAELIRELDSASDDDIIQRFKACRRILINAGEALDVRITRPGPTEDLTDKWATHLPPTEDDYEQYGAVIHALESEFRTIIEAYLTDEQIVLKDQLLTEALDVLDSLTHPGKEILTKETLDLKKSDPKWSGQHTRTAGRWSEERTPPLLTPLDESEDSMTWERTPFGEFVAALQKMDIDEETIKREGFPDEISSECVESAIQHTTLLSSE